MDFLVDFFPIIGIVIENMEEAMDDDKKQMICRIINRFGTGEHPVADLKTFKYFKPEYVNECLDKAIDQLSSLKELVSETA
jgi:hypothetical protein